VDKKQRHSVLVRANPFVDHFNHLQCPIRRIGCCLRPPTRVRSLDQSRMVFWCDSGGVGSSFSPGVGGPGLVLVTGPACGAQVVGVVGAALAVWRPAAGGGADTLACR
jgi:hypothetical protein